ncbi:MAG: T9SS type A sorting domain-containing protein [Paludibacteraceae bacterium]|nr:T9SS type A sorting domain-containing protein [Paludibacteraceae bacterium]
MKRNIVLLFVLWLCGTLSAERHIATAEQLRAFATETQTNSFAGEVVYLDADIDLESRQWTPIGNADCPFKGELNGQNHVIRNLYIFGSTGAAGLISETGAEAQIHHLALSQGQILTDGTNDVGCLVGIHRGSMHHCFNMAQILANNGNRIGGLVGTNYGKIHYCYNTGLITKANTVVGGLVGLNKSTAELSWCYNTGYSLGYARIGSLFGDAEAGCSVTNVYFDQQVTRMHATGNGSSETVLANSDHAVENTLLLRNKFSANDEWDCSEGYYPQLACFAGQDASLATTCPIILDGDELPMERAEGVGTPKEGNKPREKFNLGTLNQKTATWCSENETVIKVHSTAGYAEVFRPCGNQEVILTVTVGKDTRQVYTLVKGYDPFDAGSLGGTYVACWNETIKFAAANTSNDGKEPSGGKDDKQSSPTDYQYMIIRYKVTYDEENNRIYTPLDTMKMGHKMYGSLLLQTDEPGEYVYDRYVHDARCRTEWLQSMGRLTLIVRREFSTGELYEKPDTLYGVPNSILIDSKRDAVGGGEEFDYLWTCVQLKVDYVTGQVDTVSKGIVYGDDYAQIKTSTFTARYTAAGEYVYTRMVTEKSCTSKTQESKNKHRVVVFEKIKPGSITPFYREVCTPLCTDTVIEAEAVTGGNGRYTYRWTCNGEPIADSDSACLLLRNVAMQNGQTYVFRRQVKDDTGLMDWQTAEGEVTIVVYDAYDSGAVQAVDEQVCLESGSIQEVNLHIDNQRSANGDGEFVYCWLLYKGGNEPLLLDTFYVNSASLDTTIQLSDYSMSLPVTLQVRRMVQNSYCQTEWKASEVTAEWRLGRLERRTQPVPVCMADLPYHGEYTYQDGHSQSYTMSEDQQTIVMHDRTAQGCPMEVTLQCKATKVPVVELQPVISVCQSDSMLAIRYKVAEGAPDRYDLTFSEEALALGFQPQTNMPLPASRQINVPVPEGVPLGKYSLSIMFYAATAGASDCKGVVQTIPFRFDLDGYVHRKWNDVVFVDNSDKNCEPNCEDDLTFVKWQWYKDGQLIDGDTTQYHYEQGGLNGYYQVEMTTADGTVYRSCEYEMRPLSALGNVELPGLQIYPSPVRASQAVHVSMPTDGRLTWYDQYGRCVAVYELTVGTHTIPAPVTAGLYLVQSASAGAQVETIKIVVQ